MYHFLDCFVFSVVIQRITRRCELHIKSIHLYFLFHSKVLIECHFINLGTNRSCEKEEECVEFSTYGFYIENNILNNETPISSELAVITEQSGVAVMNKIDDKRTYVRNWKKSSS